MGYDPLVEKLRSLTRDLAVRMAEITHSCHYCRNPSFWFNKFCAFCGRENPLFEEAVFKEFNLGESLVEARRKVCDGGHLALRVQKRMMLKIAEEEKDPTLPAVLPSHCDLCGEKIMPKRKQA